MKKSTLRKVAIFDVCQTLVGVTTITDFTTTMLMSKSRTSSISWRRRLMHVLVRFARYRLHQVSDSQYRRHLITLYKGLSRDGLRVFAEEYAERLRKVCKPEILARLREHQAQGYEVYLVTGGLKPYLEPFAEQLGVHLVATCLAVDSFDRYTGTVEGIHSVGDGKVVAFLETVGDAEAIDWSVSYAYGDSVLDVAIGSMVGHPVAVDPEPALATYAVENGWEVVHTRYS